MKIKIEAAAKSVVSSAASHNRQRTKSALPGKDVVATTKIDSRVEGAENQFHGVLTVIHFDAAAHREGLQIVVAITAKYAASYQGSIVCGAGVDIGFVEQIQRVIPVARRCFCVFDPALARNQCEYVGASRALGGVIRDDGYRTQIHRFITGLRIFGGWFLVPIVGWVAPEEIDAHRGERQQEKCFHEPVNQHVANLIQPIVKQKWAKL